MNPTSATVPAPRSLVQDVRPPANHPAANSNQVVNPIMAELVDSFPVSNPIAYAPAAAPAVNNPITTTTATPSQAGGDKELDHILQDVTKGIRAFVEPPKTKRFRISANPGGNPRPIVPIITAVLVAGVLLIAAVLAFRPSTGHIRTRSVSSVGVLQTPVR